MKRLTLILLGALVACCTCFGAALAQDEAGDAYGYTADDVAVNSGAVLYWYAHGHANAWGSFPASFADMVEKGLPLRTFNSAHTGDAIDPDDGSLDFDGDIMYVAGDGCYDVEVHVQTSNGVVNVGVDSLTGNSDISGQFGPCCCKDLCGGCCTITICDTECWNLCDNTDAACKITQWIMWKSFELHECLYGARPGSEAAFYASGLSPVDANYKEYVPTMTIEYIVKGGCDCCYVKKAYVECCAPCVPCSPCAKTTCGCKDKCGSKCGGKCGCSAPKCGCKSKCGSKCGCDKTPKCGCKDKCGSKCGDKCGCSKPKCGCKSKCGDKCGCAKPKCGCKDKCGSKCGSKCGCSKPKCGCKSKCGDKCGCAKPKCGCKDKCGSKCGSKCGCSKPKCGCKSKCGDKCGCGK